jgi:predicted CopG family antitoxin
MTKIQEIEENESTRTRWKTISIPYSVYKDLIECGRMNDSFGSVIARLLEANKIDNAIVTED